MPPGVGLGLAHAIPCRTRGRQGSRSLEGGRSAAASWPSVGMPNVNRGGLPGSSSAHAVPFASIAPRPANAEPSWRQRQGSREAPFFSSQAPHAAAGGGAVRPEPQGSPLGQVEKVPLGQSQLRVPRLGVGTLQWGDAAQGYGSAFSEEDLKEAYQRLTEAGLDFFDTAEVYGYQSIKAGASSEQLLGKFEEEAGPAVIATKFFTIPWTNLLVGGGFRLGRQSLLDALRASLQRMGRKSVDLYQIHFPFPTFSNAALMEALSEAVDDGLCTAVGVSNYNSEEMAEAHALLARRSIPLASNQVRYSILSRKPESNGLLEKCKELGVSLVAYSPLASGLISEKNLLGPITSEGRKAHPVLKALHAVGEQHGASVPQVALAYLIAKGAIPIPACKNAAQAESHIATLRVKLSPGDLSAIEEVLSSNGY